VPTPPRLMRARVLDDPRLVAAARGAVRAGGRGLRELPSRGRGFGYDKNDGQKSGYAQEGPVFRGRYHGAGLLHWRVPLRNRGLPGEFAGTVKGPLQAGDSAANTGNAREFGLVRAGPELRACEIVSGHHSEGANTMDENRIAGTARNVGGKAQEGLGRATADAKTEAEGIVNQLSGAAQDLYGQARDTASDAATSAREAGSSFEKLLRNTIEQQPYTAVAISLGIGWLLGRTHRPL
jgi:uncharacterized protein YjbJ (UPF0337 family)